MNSQPRPGGSSQHLIVQHQQQQAPSSSTDQQHMVAVENAASEVIHVVSVTQASQLASSQLASSQLASMPSVSQPHQVMASLPNSNLQTITISGTNIGIPVNLQSGSNLVSSSVPSSAAQVVMTGLNASELANRLKEIPSMQVSQSGLIDVAKIKQELQHQEVAKSPGGLHEKFEPCVVCGDRASGRHYGVISCEGCKGFFKRSIRKQLGYACRGTRECPITKHFRNRCQYCRLQKCLTMGMRSESVQQERKPPEPRDKMSMNMATSTQKIYIRKDLSSPTPSVPFFLNKNDEMSSSSSDQHQGSLLANMQERVIQTDEGTVVLSDTSNANNMSTQNNTDLSTLANVVTTLATMGKKDKLATSASTSSLENGGGGDSIVKAFDTMAKAVIPQNNTAVNNMSKDFSSDSLQANMNADAQSESLVIDFNGPLLSENDFAFTLTTPSPMPGFLNVHYICETASRLLFLSMHWARAISAFPLLSQDTQTEVVRTCWNELFVLGLAQCADVMNLPTMLAAIINHLHSNASGTKDKNERVKRVMSMIVKLQDFVSAMKRLETDDNEYALLKAIVLFSPDHIGGNQTRQLEKFQEKAQHQLQEYVVTSYPAQADRLCKLLLRLPALRLLNPTIMEELFFAGLIGSVQIDSIIPYILRMETAEYTMAAAMNSVGITTAGGHPEDSMSPVSMTTTDHISNIVTNVMPQ